MKSRKPRPESGSESGFAMMAMMLALVVVGGLVFSAATRSRLLARSTVLDRGKLLTYHAATGGLALARHELASDPHYGGEELAIGNCHVTISSRSLPATAKDDNDKRWQVVVIASHPSFGMKAMPVQHRIEVVLKASKGLPAVLAFHDSDG